MKYIFSFGILLFSLSLKAQFSATSGSNEKYIEVKVSMNNSLEMNVDSYTIKYKDTDQEIDQTELENLKKYILVRL